MGQAKSDDCKPLFTIDVDMFPAREIQVGRVGVRGIGQCENNSRSLEDTSATIIQ